MVLVDVAVQVNLYSSTQVCYSGCLDGGPQSVQVLLNGIEALMVMTLMIIVKLQALAYGSVMRTLVPAAQIFTGR